MIWMHNIPREYRFAYGYACADVGFYFVGEYLDHVPALGALPSWINAVGGVCWLIISLRTFWGR